MRASPLPQARAVACGTENTGVGEEGDEGEQGRVPAPAASAPAHTALGATPSGATSSDSAEAYAPLARRTPLHWWPREEPRSGAAPPDARSSHPPALCKAAPRGRAAAVARRRGARCPPMRRPRLRPPSQRWRGERDWGECGAARREARNHGARVPGAGTGGSCASSLGANAALAMGSVVTVTAEVNSGRRWPAARGCRCAAPQPRRRRTRSARRPRPTSPARGHSSTTRSGKQ